MNDIEIRHLNLIRTVAEEGSLTKASNKLYLTQSALSHQLKDLEERFKVELFSRSGKKMHLTAAGARLLESALAVRKELDRVYEDLHEIVGGRKGVLRVSTECYTCYHWFPQVIRKFSKDFPGVDVRIDIESTHKPLEALLERKLELALMCMCDHAELPKHVKRMDLFVDEFVVIMAKDHPLAKKRFVVEKDFESHPLIVYDIEDMHLTILQDVLYPAGVSPKSVMKVPLTEAIIQLVETGAGIAALAHWAVVPALKRRTIVARPLTKKGFQRVWSAVCNEGEESTEFMQRFVQLLKNETKSMRYRGKTRALVVQSH